jgi:hypothetical protein
MLILLSIEIVGFGRSNRISEDKSSTAFSLSIEAYCRDADHTTDIASGILDLSSLSQLVHVFILTFNCRIIAGITTLTCSVGKKKDKTNLAQYL